MSRWHIAFWVMVVVFLIANAAVYSGWIELK